MNDEVQILIVEDDRTIRNLLMFGLSHAGYKITAAQNGQEAKDFLEKEEVQLILLDLYMPQMDGLKLLSWIRQEKGSDVPVIVVSAAEQEQNSIFELGANAYLAKPVSLDRLLVKVREFVQVSRA